MGHAGKRTTKTTINAHYKLITSIITYVYTITGGRIYVRVKAGLVFLYLSTPATVKVDISNIVSQPAASKENKEQQVRSVPV